MSKEMKLIVENFRKDFLLKEQNDQKSSTSPPPVGIEQINVKEFLDFYSDIEPKVEFYDRMDEEIDDLLESSIPKLYKWGFPQLSDEKRKDLVNFVGKNIRAYVGMISGQVVDVTINNLIKSIMSGIMKIMDVGELKIKASLKIYDTIIGEYIIKPILGQYLAEWVEKKIQNIVGKFDPDELGNVKNDAGRAFSVSPAVKKLISNMQDETEEKLSSMHLQNLSKQLKNIIKIIGKNRPAIDFNKCYETDGLDCFEDSQEFLETRIVDLKGFKEFSFLSGDQLALKLVADSIGAEKVIVKESHRRRRIIYRGKQ